MWNRFKGDNGEISIIQCAEQLDAPREAVADTYGNCTWHNWTLKSAEEVAKNKGWERAEGISALGLTLGLYGFSRSETMNNDTRSKSVFQYIETHDQSRFLNMFGEDKNSYVLFPIGRRRDNWLKTQPYLIALLLADGIPMLWQGQELCENNSLPLDGEGRVGFLRPVHWNYFYDSPGKGSLWLVRTLLKLRKRDAHFRPP